MYALIENGSVKQYPYGLGDVKQANPNTSFPRIVDDATMAEFGALRVYFSERPEPTVEQVLEEGTPAFDAAAQQWKQTWRVRALTAEELQAKQDATAADVRFERNRRLAVSDWTQVLDAPVDQTAWAAHRQALRDVTSQAGFPFSVQWPAEPA